MPIADQFGNPTVTTGAVTSFAGLNVAGSAGGATVDNTITGLWSGMTAPNGVQIRPVTTTGVLRWYGPSAGGPSTTADPQNSLTLASSVPITSSSVGQVIEGKSIVVNAGSGNGQCVTIAHNNVTLRRCFLQVTGGANGFGNCVRVNSGITGWVVEDCEICNDLSGTTGHNGFAPSSGGTVRRCNIHDFNNGFANQQNNMLIEDCWFFLSRGGDGDAIEIYNSGGGSSNVEIRNCTFEGVQGTGFYNSGINPTVGHGFNTPNSVTGVSIHDCCFTGFMNFAVCAGNDLTAGQVLNMQFFNSGQFNLTLTASYFRKSNGGIMQITRNDGHYVMATRGARTGALFNGTGVG